jgi:predicted ATPase
MDGVANLALKSFLTAETTYEIVQYRLLETTRAYAAEKLAESAKAPRWPRNTPDIIAN